MPQTVEGLLSQGLLRSTPANQLWMASTDLEWRESKSNARVSQNTLARPKWYEGAEAK